MHWLLLSKLTTTCGQGEINLGKLLTMLTADERKRNRVTGKATKLLRGLQRGGKQDFLKGAREAEIEPLCSLKKERSKSSVGWGWHGNQKQALSVITLTHQWFYFF